MNMLDWAKKEVEIACKKEAPNKENDVWDYGCACYESALKAFESLCQDGHSGMSIVFTKNILDRLIECKPLTAINDEDFFILNKNKIEESEEYLKERGLISSIQCPRMSSLFREESLDGTVRYSDVERVICRNISNSNNTYYSGRSKNIIDEMFPITMPYYPSSKPYIVITDDCLVDPKMGDWDTEAFYEIITPEGKHISLNKFYKYVNDEKIEITEQEFNERKMING